MHMADSLVSPAVAGTMYAASGFAAAYGIHKLKQDEDLKKKIPTMGVMGAFVFATQMVNFTIPGTGSSGHLCGGLLLTSILGPYAGFISMIGVLLIQCLFFADGGLLALGGNIWNMAFYGCFIGSLIWKAIMKNGMSKRKIMFASVFGSVITLQMGAFSVVLETLLSGVTELPFGTFLAVMQPIHLAIGAIEGLITSAVLCFVYEARSELLWNPDKINKKEGRLSYRKTIAVLVCLFLLIGGGISLLASANPDGLEWSVQQITGETEIEGSSDSIYDKTGKIQEVFSFLPDYAFKDNENTTGTSVSGIVGCAITVGLLYGIGYIIKLSSKRKRE
ncbi:MAG: energy-coupling factor ABC transporter permease [Lachnospiraceae bacterium]|nr:energy-coupling factor ABC transporter permease [Lachnospiraceae bacterium]